MPLTRHRIRTSVLARAWFATIVLGVAGGGAVGLAVSGEIAIWAVGLGTLFLGFSGLAGLHAVRDARRVVTVDDVGVHSDGVLRWADIRRVNYIERGGRIGGVQLGNDDVVLTLGTNLTDWAVIEAQVRGRFPKT